MRQWIEEQLGRFEVPGAAVAVVHDGKIVLQEGFGYRDVEQQHPVTPDTAFAIASATKAFTAAGVGALVDDGLLEWEAPVRRYITDFEMFDPVATERLTVRDLLCHRSGLPRHDTTWYGNIIDDRAAMVARLRHLKPNKDFRTTWQYNNLMYITAGYLCEVVTGEPWEALLRTRLFERMGMSSSSFSQDEAAALTPVALPYAERKGEVVKIPYAPKLVVSGPAGSIYSPLCDMVAWLRTNLNGGRLDDVEVLSPATVRELQAPQMVMPEASLYPETRDTAYGLGWFIGNYRGHKLVHHGGNIDGFTSLVTMLPEDGIGVVYLSNKGATSLRAALSFHVFDELLGLDAIPWEDRMRELEVATKGGAKAAKALAARVADRPAPHPLSDYAGEYEHPGYGRFDVELGDDVLVPRFREVPARLVHRHYDVFDLELETAEDAQISATFRTDAAGDVDALVIPLEPTVDPIVFARVPDRELTDPSFLSCFEGRYAMGPLTVIVEQARPGALTLAVVGQPPTTLLAHRGRTFKFKGNETVRATFDLDASGKVERLMLQPVGVFLPVDDDA